MNDADLDALLTAVKDLTKAIRNLDGTIHDSLRCQFNGQRMNVAQLLSELVRATYSISLE